MKALIAVSSLHDDEVQQANHRVTFAECNLSTSKNTILMSVDSDFLPSQVRWVPFI